MVYRSTFKPVKFRLKRREKVVTTVELGTAILVESPHVNNTLIIKKSILLDNFVIENGLNQDIYNAYVTQSNLSFSPKMELELCAPLEIIQKDQVDPKATQIGVKLIVNSQANGTFTVKLETEEEINS